MIKGYRIAPYNYVNPRPATAKSFHLRVACGVPFFLYLVGPPGLEPGTNGL
jgi:hypothetical protein